MSDLDFQEAGPAGAGQEGLPGGPGQGQGAELPGGGAGGDGEGLADFQEAVASLTRPAEPGHYNLQRPDLPVEFEYVPELEDSYRKLAYEAGLSDAQASKLYSGFLKTQLSHLAELDKRSAEGAADLERELRGEWGSQYEQNLGVARSTFQALAPLGSAEFQALDRAMGDSPALVRLFHDIGKALKRQGGGLDKGPAGDQGKLESKRQELLRHPAYLDRKHPEHRAVVNQINSIYMKLYPESE